MKNRYYLPVLAVLILALAGLSFAQDEWYDDSGYHSSNSVSVEPVADTNSVFDSDVYYTDSGIQRLPAPFKFDSTPAFHQHAGKTGNVKLRAAIRLGGSVLQPGVYEVRHMDTSTGHYVEFSRIVENDSVPEGMSPYQEQVVARVNCTREPLNTVVARTELLPQSASTMAQLEIRGEKAVHLF
ncbi:MAG: hypothetical protein LAN64_14835 [Acidobacteriia bacterium]|nr:hypothetical protein [Terriglobia bacterium]